MLALDEKDKEVLKLIVDGNIERKTINSYLFQNTNGCSLFVPIKEEQNNRGILVENLEDKITAILCVQPIVVGSTVNAEGNGNVESLTTHEIPFEQSVDAFNGFLIYTLNTRNIRDSPEFVAALARKIEELSPENLEKVNLIHKIVEIENYDILNYFKSNPIKVTPQQNSSGITLKPSDKRIRLHYGLTDPSEIKKEAEKRLNQYDDKPLTIEDLAHILGISNHGAQIYLFRNKIPFSKTEEGRTLEKEHVLEIIKGYNPNVYRGWMKPK